MRGAGLECNNLPRSDLKQYIGGSETVLHTTREANAAHVRLTAAKMLGTSMA